MDPDRKRYIESNYKFDAGDIVVKLRGDGVVVGYREILGHDFCYLGGMDEYKTVEVVPVNEEFEPIGTVKLNKKEDIESLYRLKENFII